METWTPHEVELALWSHHFASKLNPALLLRGGRSERTELKVKDDRSDGSGENSETLPPAEKQRKKN